MSCLPVSSAAENRATDLMNNAAPDAALSFFEVQKSSV